MKVSELGEFGLIELLAKIARAPGDSQTAAQQRLIIGIGDDAAAWRGENTIQLATIDSMVQDVHFSLDTTRWDELGWKSLAINLSDIAAMGGTPEYALVSLSLPGHTEAEDCAALYRGMMELAAEEGVTIIGGNISNCPIVVITITVTGSAGNGDGHMLTRSSAKPGDRIAVTGEPGAAAAGLEMLSRKLKFSPADTVELKRAFLRPRPRIAEGKLLLDKGIKTAIDISDGLISDLNHICEASRVGARVEIDRIPIHRAARANFGDRAAGMALGGGEDYELLFTGSAEAIKEAQKEASCPITIIGEITDDEKHTARLIDGKGRETAPGKAGWEHFR